MTRSEFFEWLDSCPSHEWQVQLDDHGYISVSFAVEETEETEMETTNV